METIDTQLKFMLTNGCTCTTYNEDTGNWDEAPECWGDCWEFSVEDFAQITAHLYDNNETQWWEVTNLKLWNGDTSGYFKAKTIEDVIAGMTVRSEWNMEGTVYEDRVEYSLSHHDAPMGSTSVLRPVSLDKQEQLGLY